MKEKRKIDLGDSKEFHLCKPKPGHNSDFHKYGKDKSMKAINDLIERDTYDLVYGTGVIEKLNQYREKKGLPALRVEEGKLVSLVEQK
jgi:hypothetical protein